MDNFNLKKYLVENKITRNSQMLKEEEAMAELTVGGKTYELGSDDPNDDGTVVKIEKYPNGYFITGAVYDSPEQYVEDPEGENAEEAYGYAIDLEGNDMEEDDLEGKA